MFELAVARAPREKERASLQSFLNTQRDWYRAHPDDAAKLLATGFAPPPAKGSDQPELAAWTNLCRVMLNTQESITRY